MTVDEIKATYTMREIVERYGFQPNRAGFIHCPFHSGDRTASMKIYPKDFHCHACGANGDIFTFVQRMENISFKEAYERLGGSYSHDFKSRLNQYHRDREKAKKAKLDAKLAEEKRINNLLISAARHNIEVCEPFSDDWCYAVNVLEYQLYLLRDKEHCYEVIEGI